MKLAFIFWNKLLLPAIQIPRFFFFFMVGFLYKIMSPLNVIMREGPCWTGIFNYVSCDVGFRLLQNQS